MPTFPFYLSYPAENTPSGELGSLDEWQVEWKWDGIRAQLIKRDGRVMIWSRRRIGRRFLSGNHACRQCSSSDACLDGEILAWGKDGLNPFRGCKKAWQKTSRSGILKKEPVRFQWAMTFFVWMASTSGSCLCRIEEKKTGECGGSIAR